MNRRGFLAWLLAAPALGAVPKLSASPATESAKIAESVPPPWGHMTLTTTSSTGITRVIHWTADTQDASAVTGRSWTESCDSSTWNVKEHGGAFDFLKNEPNLY